MTIQRRRRFAALTGAGMCAAMVVTACGAPSEDSGLSEEELDCATYEEFGDFTEEKPAVSIYTPITDAEGDAFEQAWAPFVECTGIQIQYEGSNDFEAQIEVRVTGGDAPDIAFFPQPGLMARYKDDMVPASDALAERAAAGWSEDWLQYGTFDGTLYAQPMSANLKSLVWYSPKLFKDNGYTVPETWDDLIKLSDTIAADLAGTEGAKPWCAGIDSGEATGWPVTDWVEDMMLREHGGDVYDQWVSHELPFNDSKVADAVDKAGSILKNEDYMNGGYGDVGSMTGVSFEEGGLPILDGTCALHRQASFYSAQWPDGTEVGPEGDVFAFYLPGNTADDKPLLGGGEFVAAFREAEEVDAVRQYLASGLFANARMKTGAWASAHADADPANAADPMMQLTVELFHDEGAEFRFDASDLMPGHVGSDSFFDEMTQWINGKSTGDALDAIEETWES
ncbi:ABC transporter substrate-binding protein [Stackebrandtia albiflava]|nr:ABC transporter substrate-binding protein [Stackebrandtia albiflava]